MIFVPAVQPRAATTPLAWCFAFVEGQLLLPEADNATLQPQPLQGFDSLAVARHYLGRLDGIDCWALHLSAEPAGWRRAALRAAMLQFPDALMGVASRAAQVLEWDRAHRFCGVCGMPTDLQAHERSRKCPACGHAAYPRLSPAMMVLIWRGRELLLARSPHYAPGMFSALAGFVEPGESLEECVHREVAEEVGVTVRELRYFGSQSWPFPHSLMVAYTAQWVGGEVVPQEDEIEAAGWFDIDALPGIPPRFSIAGHLIRDTVEALRAGRAG
ncbi:MAG: NAD(+) diphosphatase [Burkholderiales bacterium]|nr:MAG: NAD(+) diphosphatase [Burkholderiales bacterium]